MDLKNLDPKVLARYLSGDGTEKDNECVEQWIRQDGSNERKLKEFQYFWEKAAMNNRDIIKAFDTERDWLTVKQQMYREKTNQTEYARSRPKPYRYWGQNRVYKFISIAAVLFIAAFVGFLAYQNWSPVENVKGPVLEEIATAMGQRVNLTLSDGSRVTLNADSRLKLPEVFETGKREVYLQGEAYFDITPNPDKPFIIHLNSTVIRVLGTSFSVSAYPEDKIIQVVVKEGRVSFNAEQKAEQTIVSGHELVQYNLITHQLKTRKVKDLSLYLSWLEGYLKFKETPMSEVATDLERRYNVDVTFRDEEIKDLKLTAFFKSWQIQSVLEVMTTSLEIGYQFEDNRVVFYKR